MEREVGGLTGAAWARRAAHCPSLRKGTTSRASLSRVECPRMRADRRHPGRPASRMRSQRPSVHPPGVGGRAGPAGPPANAPLPGVQGEGPAPHLEHRARRGAHEAQDRGPARWHGHPDGGRMGVVRSGRPARQRKAELLHCQVAPALVTGLRSLDRILPRKGEAGGRQRCAPIARRRDHLPQRDSEARIRNKTISTFTTRRATIQNARPLIWNVMDAGAWTSDGVFCPDGRDQRCRKWHDVGVRRRQRLSHR